MNTKVTKKEELGVIIGFVIILFIVAKFSIENEQNRFRKNGVFTTGTVIKVKDDYRGRPYVSYFFSINNIKYFGESSYPEFRGDIEESLINKNFPVIYLKNAPKESKVLISRTKFKFIDKPFPDSLLWTKNLETY